MKAEFKNKLDEFYEVRNQLVSKLSEEFPKLFTEVFEKYPKMNTFSWTQYTPYFADGDVCEFSVNSYASGITINSIDGYDDEREGWMDDCTEEISNILEEIDENIMKDIFGDHVMVTVNKYGTSQEDHDHD